MLRAWSVSCGGWVWAWRNCSALPAGTSAGLLALVAALVSPFALANSGSVEQVVFADLPDDVVAAVRLDGRGSHWVDEADQSKGLICYGEGSITNAGPKRSPSYGLMAASTLAHTLALGEAAEMLAAKVGSDTGTALSRVGGEEVRTTTVVVRTIAEASFLGTRVVRHRVTGDRVWIALWIRAEPVVTMVSEVDAESLAREFGNLVLGSELLVRSQSLAVMAPSGQVFLVVAGLGPEDPETTMVDRDGETIRRGGEVDASRVARDNCDYALAAAKSGSLMTLNAAYCSRQEATRIRDAAGRLSRVVERQRSYSYRLAEGLRSDGVRGARDNVRTAEQRDPNRKLLVHVEVIPIRP